MHLAPLETLHVYQTRQRRAEVQRVREQHTSFRIVYKFRYCSDGEWHTLSPDYLADEETAKQKARAWAYRPSE